MSSALAYHLSDALLTPAVSPALAAVNTAAAPEDVIFEQGCKLIACRLAVVGFDSVADVGLVVEQALGCGVGFG